MKILQCIKNDVVVNYNDVIRISHCALNIESTKTVVVLTFEWTFQVTKSKKAMQFHFVLLKMLGLKNSDSDIFIIL